MKVKLLVIGRTNDEKLKDLMQVYIKRIKHYLNFELIEIPDVKKGKKMSQDALKELEADLILSKIDTGEQIILLDEKGEQFTSKKFSQFIEKKMIYSHSNIVFVVGGAYGFSEKVYKVANKKLSLSSMTFSHQMIRLLFVEQLYRAMTIIKKEPYHHE